MKLSIKVKAFLQLLALVAAGIAGSELVNFVSTTVPRETIMNAIAWGCIGGLLYVCYGLLLARLAYQETLENLNKKG